MILLRVQYWVDGVMIFMHEVKFYEGRTVLIDLPPGDMNKGESHYITLQEVK